MKERIIKIMEKEQMTPSKFAEEIGIQRSALSHILSGRNKASLDVLMKILARFDYLNTDWLLFGKGSMFRPDKVAFQPQLFDETEKFAVVGTDEPEYSKENELKKIPSEPNIIDKEAIKLHYMPSRNVSKILLFYSDNTFETFVPQKEE
ncbi:MAG: helix-turn-helix transcriptional regulator [Bacteroidales bacterium]|nr:helix-turn-helix transcriptional regulator [Bacteroidales bacterium]